MNGSQVVVQIVVSLAALFVIGKVVVSLALKISKSFRRLNLSQFPKGSVSQNTGGAQTSLPLDDEFDGQRRSREEALMRRVRGIAFGDGAKVSRLIEFERNKLRREGRSEEPVASLMERAIERWEQDNR
jgi:hypothetical protein